MKPESTFFSVVSQGKIKVNIVVGTEGPEAEKLAARDLQRYIVEITGKRVPIKGDSEVLEHFPETELILVGSHRTNKVTAELVKNGFLEELRKGIGSEGFMVKTLEWKGKRFLVLSGFNKIGTSHAVYYFLERCCGVGFFRDGDRVPKKTDLTLERIDFVKKGNFKFNAFWGEHAQWALSRHRSPQFWTLDEWKNFIDFIIKRRFNTLLFGAHSSHFWGEIWLKAFPWLKSEDIPSILPLKLRTEIIRNAVSYARERGLNVAYPIMWGLVPKRVLEKVPAKYHISIFDATEGSPYFKWVDLCLADPNIKQVMKAFLNSLIETIGRGDIYFIWTRLEGLICPEAATRATAYVDAYNLLKDIDPKARVGAPTFNWNWGVSELDWRVQWEDFKKRVPKDVVVENWDNRLDLFYETKGFEGRPWWIVHSISFETMVLPFTCRLPSDFRVKDALEFGAEGYVVCSIIGGAASLFYNFASELSWNPDLEFSAYLKDYAERRYGSKSAENMYNAFVSLLEAAKNRAVFGHIGNGKVRFGLDGSAIPIIVPHGPYCAPPEIVEACLEKCRRALEYALKEKRRQEDNPLYQNDLTELKIICLKLEGTLHYQKAYTYLWEMKTKDAASEFKESSESFNALVNLLQGDERYDLSLTRKWLEKNFPDADLEFWETCSKVHSIYVTYRERIIDLRNKTKRLAKLSEKAEKYEDLVKTVKEAHDSEGIVYI